MPISMAIFGGDAFTQASMITGIEKRPYIPSTLERIMGFQPRAVSTDTIYIGTDSLNRALIQTTLRGAPIEMGGKRSSNIRPIGIPRLAKGNTLYAHELANLSPPDGVTAEVTVAARITEMQEDLIADLSLTEENMRLGALNGIIYDSDGTTVLANFFTEFGVSQPADVDLTLDNASMTIGELREKIATLIAIPIARASQAGNSPRFRIRALCGDNFWFKLTGHPAVAATYQLNAAADLRQERLWEEYPLGGVDWIHWRGLDDGTSMAISTNKAKVFPVGVNGMFQHIMGPANEFFDLQNQPGRRYVPFLLRDKDRDQWVQPEIYAYPLFVNARPDLVMTATV